MNLQVDDFPFRQKQAATSEDKQSKHKANAAASKGKTGKLKSQGLHRGDRGGASGKLLAGLLCFARGRWAAVCPSAFHGTTAAGTVPLPAASIFCSSQQNVVPISIRCWHVHITGMGPIAQ